MRQEVLDYINTLSLGGFLLTSEYPWDDNGTALYIKNPKKIYVDNPQTSAEPFIQTLGSTTFNNETTSISVYFSTDAKQISPQYDTLVSDLKTGKDITTIDGLNRRECDVTTSFENDLLITELEYRFTKLI
jgi:hypothetical protein